jgi:hypothetical protein
MSNVGSGTQESSHSMSMHVLKSMEREREIMC